MEHLILLVFECFKVVDKFLYTLFEGCCRMVGLTKGVNMKIRYEEMWASCEFFIPQIKVLREKKISANLHTWVSKVAVQIFLISDTA